VGRVYENQHNWKASEGLYLELVRKFPREPGAHFLLGNLYRKMNRTEEAEREFKAELEVNPYNAPAAWRLGEGLIAQGQPREATAWLEKALDLDPRLSGARQAYGKLLLDSGKPADAVRILEEAVKSEPAEPSLRFLLSRALRDSGQSERAEAEHKVFAQLAAEREAAKAAAASRLAGAMESFAADENAAPSRQ
jgi:predicted Zn-dependent protease